MTRPRSTTPRKKALEPITFVPVEHVFTPQVKVRATRDISGWADRGKKSGKRVKWSIPAGEIVYLDEPTAREFHVKGYVQIIEGDLTPVSDDERAEMLSTVTTLSLGGPNG